MIDIYEYAMKVERDGERYYRELAEKAKDIGVKSILTMLADEEVKHFVLFELMSQQKALPIQEQVDVFKHTQNMFEKMKKENLKLAITNDEIKLYQNALNSEKHSYTFYQEKAKMLEEGEQKEAFLRIAEEERKHMELLENLVEYVSMPSNWIESAEFNNDNPKTVQGLENY